MWTFDLDQDENVLPSDIEEWLNELPQQEQEKFIDIFSNEFLSEIGQLEDEACDKDEDIVDRLVFKVARETKEKMQPSKVDNWKNGLDLL
jgi:hypothetical protein